MSKTRLSRHRDSIVFEQKMDLKKGTAVFLVQHSIKSYNTRLSPIKER
jgi:hypothetical protein